ncbi:type I restriction-modification system endonuclease [Cellvibrio sp. QJXJ]|uniref:type I restriction-modification system endonuclease n=1 Tax=Cellvibrio sp. QJXJ TaxID=2964606 RepID=UPI0021C402E4|nr:type I restriction-modification system endonuclease [Cellvibrio sp. QJXJ]UUA71795.1 type I restriction-modification system endonuclease [Cellvibrio sp. QJXJ]
MISSSPESTNFDFLQEHDPVFVQLAAAAERSFISDPNTTLIKLRQLGEAIAQDLAARCNIRFDERTTQLELLQQIRHEIRLEPNVLELFHLLRVEGNKATHQFKTHHKEAITGMRAARELAVWYQRAFGKQGAAFKPAPFAAPKDPSIELRELQIHIAQLKSQLTATNQQASGNTQLQELLQREKEEYEVLAQQMDAEARQYKQLAQDTEKRLIAQQQEFEARIKQLQDDLALQSAEHQKILQQQVVQVSQKTQKASSMLSLNEELTRAFIDKQLIEAGWEADTQELDYKKGARPEKGKNKAIAEWPTTAGQRADYVLFAGLIPIAVVEAKRENENVAGKIPQAERYSRGFKMDATLMPAWAEQGRTIAWPDAAEGHFHIPFVYSCNGRAFVKQLKEQSGTWFRDVREPSNIAEPREKFHSPAGLLDKLKRSRELAEQKLKAEGFTYLKLRDYQEKAIVAVESALANDQRNCLLAMATGTGKTRTIIGLIYRFLKAERFKRILFLVDRTALGNQALDSFKEAKLEENKTLSSIYNIAELGDMAAEAETRVQVATVQAMVKRLFASDNPPTIDAYDCIIVDEAHRGYTLDQEMTEGELATRDAAQYLSSYRRVLDYFDAVKIGLTATPAKHTSEIFGKPVYTYSYREAVADDWLIDHEPPIRYETLLSKNGIKLDKGSAVSAINTYTGEIESALLEDEINFDVEAFNRKVITEGFNQVICEQLAKELDPFGDEKTMIFCATDLHADMVKRLLDEAFKEIHNGSYSEAAVRKITGKSDKVDQLIRNYKNERYPNIAITVDLLTTGIDVPKICHLVFLRRVKSRILYEQMIGRATRRADDIGKTVFKIYDPVDIYAALQSVSTMKPLVRDPNITLEQLVDELTNPDTLEKGLNAPGVQADTSHAQDVLAELGQKIMRVMRKAHKAAESKPELKQKLDELENLWGVAPQKLHQHLHELGPRQAAEFMRRNNGFIKSVDEVKFILGSEHRPIIYEGRDEFLTREQNFGVNEKPADYLLSFNDFIKNNINHSAALAVVVNKPKDLTRDQLKEIKVLLDNNGYSETKLKAAWRNSTNQEIAASIIGHIRQAALGEPLIPFDQRVNNALQKILASHCWLPPQRKCLERLGKQLVHEVIIDQGFVNSAFAQEGGAKRVDKLLDNQLNQVLGQLAAELWG